MNAYSISKLAQNAGVSVHVVRDYVLRGLLRPCRQPAGELTTHRNGVGALSIRLMR